ncbi:maleylacetoacetate isomerase [Phenylobacterium sp.]|uniref:maleylacetoacetate isomerase n=1 Tax=Phenylobacterium sp. TaxID=1871053 RepID=UPI0035AF228F
MKLYTNQRNSAGERVRIALNLKGIAYDYVSVPSLAPGEYRRINPQGLMPALEVDGQVIAQSGAILAYLEEGWPEPPLLPADPIVRGQARAFAQHIAAEMHALTVNRVRRFLAEELAVDEAGVERWLRHWMTEGFTALEAALAQRPADWPFCFSETPGWADLHLVPQLRNGRRFGCDLSPYPLLLAVEARCAALDAFIRARPENQPDYTGA